MNSEFDELAIHGKLMKRGIQWTRDLPRNRLISSRVDQKLRTKKGEYMLFKEKFGLKMVADWRDRWGDLMAPRGRFLAHGSWLQFRDESASIWPLNNMHFSHDRATIGPWSGLDRATIVSLVLRWLPSESVGRFVLRFSLLGIQIVPRSDPDRAAIGIWSHHERGSCGTSVCRPIEIRWVLGGPDIAITIHCQRPLDGDLTVLLRRFAHNEDIPAFPKN